MGNPHQMGAAVMAAGWGREPAGRRGEKRRGRETERVLRGVKMGSWSDGRGDRIWGVCSPCLFRGLAFWAVRKLR